MRGWPVYRPTHAPATALRTNGNSAPPPKPKTPRAVSPEAACVSDHSRGQALPPANPLSPNDNNTPTIVIPDIISRKRKENIRNLRRKAGMTPHWRECEAPLRRTQRGGADETILGGCFPSRLSPRRMSGILQTKNPLVLPLPRRHAWLAAPAANTCSRNNPQNKRQQRPPQNQKTKSASILVASLRACEKSPQTKNPSCRLS